MIPDAILAKIGKRKEPLECVTQEMISETTLLRVIVSSFLPKQWIVMRVTKSSEEMLSYHLFSESLKTVWQRYGGRVPNTELDALPARIVWEKKGRESEAEST